MCRGRGARTDQVVLSPGTGPRRLALFGTTPTAPLAPTAGSPKPLENLMFPCIPLMCTSCTADIVSWVLFTVPVIPCDASSASCCLPWTPAKESLVKEFKMRGLPTSILIDKNGKEFGRVLGEIDFSSNDFIKFIKKYS